ncbi:MAG: hypothetical protein HN976_19625, partial [Lentisphaerae bacterium]|nr:hypothetical protein [Lentisphaerota bacterium]
MQIRKRSEMSRFGPRVDVRGDRRPWRSGVFALALVVTALLVASAVPAFGAPVPAEQARRAAERFLLSERMGGDRSEPPAITSSTAIADAKGSALAYVHCLEREGFVITAADDVLRPVLGFSGEGRFIATESPGNVLLHLVRWDVEARLRHEARGTENGQANKRLWALVISGDAPLPSRASSREQWGPWISSNWHQSGQYNNECPYVIPHVPGLRRPVGCVATATAQILNHWRFPRKFSFSSSAWPEGDAYSKKGIDFDGDAAAYGFPTFTELNDALDNITYSGDSDEIAMLNFGVGLKVRMAYGHTSSGAFMGDVAPAILDSFGYGSAVFKGKRSGAWTECRTSVVTNLKQGRPVELGIHKSSGWDGHAVICDGYRDPDGYFHINFGWEFGSGTTWYDLPDSYGSYDVVNSVIYDILPDLPWSQVGADEHNTHRSPYGVPTASSPTIKWAVNTSFLPEHTFVGLGAGAGGDVFMTFRPQVMNDNHTPGISVFDKFGVRREAYYLTSERNSVSSPAITSGGEVFVATSEGGIYHVDTVAKSTVKIYQAPGGEGFDGDFKVDEEDRLYACTTTTLYCLQTDGTLKWTYSLSGGRIFYRQRLAIDSGKGSVYIGYYDGSAKTGHLAAISRATGQLKYQKTLATDATYGSWVNGIPSVADDGTVYVVGATTLYALTPQTSSFATRWQKDGRYYAMSVVPAVGPDGTVYMPYWTESGWRYLAHDAANGSSHWEISFSTGDYDNPLQPYVGGNGVLLCGMRRANRGADSFELYAYKDNGASASLLWQKDWGTVSGAGLAFGAGETLYVLPGSQGSKVFALSEGTVGDPEGGGVGYSGHPDSFAEFNDQAPNTPNSPSPASGAQNQGTTVQLSWACSDPDGGRDSLRYDVHVCELTEEQDGNATSVVAASGTSTTNFTLDGLTPGATYLWTVTATDGQTVTHAPTWSFTTAGSSGGNVSGVHSSPGYQPGGTCTVNCTINYTGTPSTIGWSSAIPDGWSYSSGTDEPGTKPTFGDEGTLEWTWTTVPSSPARFSFTLAVPEGETGDVQFASLVKYRDSEGGPEQAVATPTSLVVSEVLYHTADTGVLETPPEPNWRLSQDELMRVIQLYNYRSGPTRTGDYHRQDGTEDGYGVGPGDQTGTAHSADTGVLEAPTEPNWRLSQDELMRVIQLYNYRSGATRTGEYRRQDRTEDGYAPGSSARRSPSRGGSRSLLSATHVAEPACYSQAGGQITVSCELTYDGDPATIGWSATIPDGWSYVSGTDEPGTKPELGDEGTLEWTWTDPPASPVAFSYTLTVPSGQSGNKEISARAKFRSSSGGPEQQLASPDPLTIPWCNHAPTAVGDATPVDEDTTTANLHATLLGNDTDPDADDTKDIQSVDT